MKSIDHNSPIPETEISSMGRVPFVGSLFIGWHRLQDNTRSITSLLLPGHLSAFCGWHEIQEFQRDAIQWDVCTAELWSPDWYHSRNDEKRIHVYFRGNLTNPFVM
ncbi:hypothetical protein T265_09285 [Opisthorchis viverrini]|uniref:Uncharacterized protein n=1 Tax=Opisthorchis viverrini TaxID=6198 RepID=A0A074ZAV9_OPIVI|nr:hypothetical protein T265_09285 [Opisthorchis viverrini]KER22662.1 hypothetical protein T265_09285 [Opisthorchis viverrini]